MQRFWRSVTGLYHVTVRGVGKQLIFEDDDDRWEFLNRLRFQCKEGHVTVLAWCLMSNHVHLVLADYDDAMSTALQKTLSGYARYFNKKTGRCGHLFQNRFERFALDNDAHLLAAIRYVHANPQKAGICRLQHYPWSSYREYLQMFEGGDGVGISAPVYVVSMWKDMEDFIDFSLNLPDDIESLPQDMQESERERLLNAKEIAQALGCSLYEVKGLVRAERDPVLFALYDAGYSSREIERYTGVSRSTVSRSIRAYEQVKSAAESA